MMNYFMPSQIQPFLLHYFGFICWMKMIYRYLRPLIWIFNIFGVTNPLVSSDGKPLATNLWLKMWSLLVAIALITSYITTIEDFEFSLKSNLEQISDINDLATNVAVILLTLIHGDTACINLYETVVKVFEKTELEHKIIKLFTLKMYSWFCIPTLAFSGLIILEFVKNRPPFILIIRTPTFLSALHLFIHLYVIDALLKVVNDKLHRALKCYNPACNEEWSKRRILAYFISPDIKFIQVKDDHCDLKQLCEIYDDLTTCNQLLEKLHGLQILLSIWQMFSCAVAGVTLIACDRAKTKWLVIVKTMLPFIWSFIGCYIDDQLQRDVDQTKILLIKRLIDYRCDSGRKVTLETFKQLVSINRLQFTACNVFSLNYAMLLGTIMNVITYSIIMIQFFLSN